MIKKLEGADLDAFVKSATPEKLAEYYNAVNEMERKEIKALIDAKSDKTEVDARVAKLESEKEKQMAELNAKLEQIGLALKKVSDIDRTSSTKDASSLRKCLEEKKAELAKMKGNKNVSISFKAAGAMLMSNNISGGNVPVEQRLSGLNYIPSRRIRLMDIVSRGQASSPVISWVYQANKDGAAGGTAEGAAKNQIDFDLVVASESVKKRTAYIKVSEEMLDDIDFMESEIRIELMKELMKDIESQVYAGSGSGTNLNGIATVATAFSAGSFAGTVDNANEIDVLTVAMNQIAVANQDQATYALVHPNMVTRLKLIKTSSTDRRYVDRLTMVAGQLSLDGVTIIPTTLVTDDKYLIGNFELARVYDKGEVSIEIGIDQDDFTKNMRTILAEWRGLVIVKNNDRTAFIKGDFSDDIAALETP